MGLAGLSVATGSAAAGDPPEFLGLTRDVGFEPDEQFGEGEATRADTNRSDLTVTGKGAIRYSSSTTTTVDFVGFDPNAPSGVDVAQFELTRGTIGQTVFQTVDFAADFRYAAASDVDDFFVDMIGDTLVE